MIVFAKSINKKSSADIGTKTYNVYPKEIDIILNAEKLMRNIIFTCILLSDICW